MYEKLAVPLDRFSIAMHFFHHCLFLWHNIAVPYFMEGAFDYTLDFSRINFREQPGLYRTGKGEQGVLLVEPYKSEILPHWQFKTPVLAKRSVKEIMALFRQYKKEKDFIGMDMARKFLQMGYTRARRYANHKSGKKYKGPVPEGLKGRSGAHGRPQLPLDPDPEKAASAAVFYKAWQKVKEDKVYVALLAAHKAALRS